jgi:hypothetical protein
VSSRDHGHDYAKDRDRSKDYSRNKDRDRHKGTVHDRDRYKWQGPYTRSSQSLQGESGRPQEARRGFARRTPEKDAAALHLIQRGIDQATVSVLNKLLKIIPMYARFSMLRRWLRKLTGQKIDCYLLSFPTLRVTLAYLAYMSMFCLTQERGRRTISMKRRRRLGFGRWSYTFDLIIYNDLLAGDETISITVNEIPSTYAVLLGRKTIKQNSISLKCFRFLSNLETGESLFRGFVPYN